MPVVKSNKQAEQEILEKKATFSLKNADRDLDERELEAEEKATKFSRAIFKRIPPIPGTLGFMLRNIKGGNASVIEFLRWAQVGEKTNRTAFIKTFLILWDNMDEFSQRRVDIFDQLCRKYDIPLKRFWGVLQEGMFDHNEQITQTALSGYKPEFIQRLMALADKEKNHQDRRLMAEALNLSNKEPLVKIEDKSQHLTVNQTNNLPSFANSIKRSEKTIRHQDIEFPEMNQPKMLSEGETDFIDVETFSDTRELEKDLAALGKEI